MDKGTDREIFSKRLVIAVAWNICLQMLFAIALVFIIQIDFLHPISWFTSTMKEIFGLKITFNIVLLVLVSVSQAFVYGRYQLLPPPKYFTRFSMFLNMFTLHNFMFSLLYSLSGYFTICLYSSLTKADYYNLKKNCQKYDGQCLLEDSLFLQFGGMWMGLHYFLTKHVLASEMLLFPHVYQNKHHYIKQVIMDIITNGFQNAARPVIYYCAFYIFFGNSSRSMVSSVYSLYLEDPPLDNLFNLLRSSIWMSLWFYSGLFFISVNIMKIIFNTVLTQPMKFPIESERNLTLHEAIEQRGHFNGVLAAQDLRILSINDPIRRSQIFRLSQPGGHPKNWNNILEKCLITIQDFTKELESITADPKIENKIPPNNNVCEKMPTFSNIRNLADSPAKYEMKGNIQNGPVAFETIFIDWKQMLHKLCQKPGISYLFGELVETKLKVLLIQAQPVVWTCEGLAFLTAASLNEDKYGTVQYDLPQIISTLLNLKQSLDKIAKPNSSLRKPLLNNSVAFKMRTALLSAVKRSIYKITITFSEYINDIPLSRETQAAIHPFILLKEA